jgi:hypothetical protein
LEFADRARGRNKVMLKRTLLTAIMSLFLGLAPAVLLINPASAQSSDGAQVSHHEVSCNAAGVCFTVDGVANITQNKNLFSFIVHSDITGVNNEGSCTVDASRSDDFHQLFKFDTGPQVRTFKTTNTALVECPGQPTQLCTFSQTFVFANGEFRFEALEPFTCINV